VPEPLNPSRNPNPNRDRDPNPNPDRDRSPNPNPNRDRDPNPSRSRAPEPPYGATVISPRSADDQYRPEPDPAPLVSAYVQCTPPSELKRQV
jgi:hypothetical protein